MAFLLAETHTLYAHAPGCAHPGPVRSPESAEGDLIGPAERSIRSFCVNMSSGIFCVFLFIQILYAFGYRGPLFCMMSFVAEV